ncbi:MAG: phage portal protein [Pseudomonadota bacterium]
MKNPFRWRKPAQQVVPENKVPTAERKGVSGPTAPLAQIFALSHAHWSKADYRSLAQRGFMGNPVVHRCIRLIAQTASRCEYLVFHGREEQADHPLRELLRKPSSLQAGRAFIEALVGHLMLSGNGFIELSTIADEPRELHLLRPDRVDVRKDGHGWPVAFDVRQGESGASLRHVIPDHGVSPILHIAQFHPLEDLGGFAPLQAAVKALDLHEAASNWNKALLDNSARPSGALVYGANSGNGQGANLTDEQFDRLRRELEDGYMGQARAGRPLLLEGGLDWKAMSHSPRDMDFLEMRNGAARDIALAFGVPPMLLGIPGDNTFSNYREANRAFMQQTVIPLVQRIFDSIGAWLAPYYSDDLRLTLDEDKVPGTEVDRTALWKRVANADFLTDAEKRVTVGFSPEPEQEGSV